MRRATSLKKGQIILQAGKVLRAIECGLLAEVGWSQISVFPRPNLAILATGNELVDFDQTPGPGQIRNSNGLLLQSLAIQAGATVPDVACAKDDREQLKELILSWGLTHNVLVIAGGVSAGVLDLVPQVLRELDVEQVFHKVNLKPGKPLWFGVRRHAGGDQTLVFGLPGNPVSALVCFELFVRPAIQKMRGLKSTGLRKTKGNLACDHQQRGERPTCWPAAIEEGQVSPLPWKGSGDLRTLTDANCLGCFPAGDRLFRAGEPIDVLLLDDAAQ
jgi:molybdopterin molybdotransferase